MNKISILVKSFAEDLNYCERLFKSFTIHNKDALILYLVVPENDIKAFSLIANDKNIKILSENLFSEYLTSSEVNGIRPGYINQEIIKLAFHELEYCENYFCCDSDGYFLRDFFISDFLYKKDIPYSILIEDKELQVDPHYYNTHWKGRIRLIEKIKTSIGFDCPFTLTNHAFSVFSCKVLKDLKEAYMCEKKLTYINLMEISPYEFSWYSLWLQYSNIIPIYHREPLFKFFHYKGQHLEYMIRGVKEADIARAYIGVNINSNYSKGMGVIGYQSNIPKTLANYISFKDVIYVNFYKIYSLITRAYKKFNKLLKKTKCLKN